jgi:2',3'-cyclic-nucleotide 2'-phosphodiesterase (5'-nucleotidase family)
MRTSRRLLSFVVLLVTGCRATIAPRTAASDVVTIVHFNDIYTADTLRDGSGGLARVAALRDQLAARSRRQVLLTFGGDVLGPSLLSKWYAGAQMIDAMNTAGVDYAVLGNHEFDFGRDVLLARLRESRFRWLSANCRLSDGSALPNVRGWDTLTVNDVRIGLFGVTIVRDYGRAFACTDEDAAARAAVDTLVRVGAQQIIALTHRFVFEDRGMLVADKRIGLVLGGHEHEDHREVLPDGRRVLKGTSNAGSAWIVQLSPTGVQHDSVVPMHRGRAAQPTTAAVVARWQDTLTRRIGPDRVIARTATVIDAIDSTSRKGESVLGDLVADGIRFGSNADVGLINSGSMRYDDYLGPGALTRHQLESIFLYADETRVVTFTMSGARLRELLEHSVIPRNLGGGGSLQVSGIRLRFDPNGVPGSRLVGPIQRDDGRVIGSTDTLRVSFVGFPACKGGDGYRVPEAASACAALDADPSRAPRAVDLLMQHLEERLGGEVRIPSGGRIGPQRMNEK